MRESVSKRLRSCIFLASVGSLAIAGCASDDLDGGHVETKTSALLGAPEDVVHKFSIGVCGQAPVGGACRSHYCTGTLVAPNLVLTARHCVGTFTAAQPQFCDTSFAGNIVAATSVFVTSSN